MGLSSGLSARISLASTGFFALALSGGVLAAGMSDLQISGPSSVLPEQQPAPEYVVSWQGGTAPWTVVFDASDPGFNRRQEIDVPAQAYCTSAGFQTGCGTFPIQVLYGTPQISRITATVTDSTGETVAQSLNVRVGSDGLFYVRNMPTVDIRPDGGKVDQYLCLGGPEDDPLITLGGDPLAPTFNLNSDPLGDVADPAYVRVFASEPDGQPLGVVYGIANQRWADETFPDPLEDTLIFPVTYGDYTVVNTVPWDNPAQPSPPVEPLQRYTVRVPRPPQCNDGLQTRNFEFYVNPPTAGDPVVVTNDANGMQVDGATIDSELSLTLDRSRTIQARQIFVGCMNQVLVYQAIAIIRAEDRGYLDDLLEFCEEKPDPNCKGIEDKEDLIVELLFRLIEVGNDKGAKGDVIKQCREIAGLPPEGAAGEQPGKQATGAAKPADEAETEAERGLGLNFEQAGSTEVEIPYAIEVEVQTAHARVTVTGPTSFLLAQVPDGGTSILAAQSEPLTVVPLDDTLPTRTVEPGYAVLVDETTISEPIFAFTPEATPPNAPASVCATDGDFTDKVAVTWPDVAGEEGYEVYRCDDSTTGSCAKTADLAADATKYDDEGAAADGTQHYYRVKACNAAGCSDYSPADTGFRGAAPAPERNPLRAARSGAAQAIRQAVGGPGGTCPVNNQVAVSGEVERVDRGESSENALGLSAPSLQRTQQPQQAVPAIPLLDGLGRVIMILLTAAIAGMALRSRSL